MEEEHARFLDKEKRPEDREINSALLEAAPAWDELCSYIASAYGAQVERVFFGKSYGWADRCRKASKTLLYLFPEKGAFTALVVIGEALAEKAAALDLSQKTRRLMAATPHLRDGQWLYIRCMSIPDTSDVKKLVSIKRKPAAEGGRAHRGTGG